jgi:nitrogen fixation protein FixH
MTQRSRYIPWLFVGAFAVVLGANTVLVVAASSTRVGLVVAKPYEKGIAYNRTLERLKTEEALGWMIEGDIDSAGRIVATVLDRARQPLDGLQVEALFVRPVEGTTLPVAPLAADGGGRYRGAIAVPQRGQWDMTLLARAANGDSATAQRRLVLR